MKWFGLGVAVLFLGHIQQYLGYPDYTQELPLEITCEFLFCFFVEEGCSGVIPVLALRNHSRWGSWDHMRCWELNLSWPVHAGQMPYITLNPKEVV